MRIERGNKTARDLGYDPFLSRSILTRRDSRYVFRGDVASGDLQGLYPRPNVTWANGYPTYDDRYVEIGEELVLNTTRVATTYAILTTDYAIFCDTDGGAFTVSLPAGVEGQVFKIMNVGTSGNALTVDPDGTEELYGAGAGVASTVHDGEVININYNATEGWF